MTAGGGGGRWDEGLSRRTSSKESKVSQEYNEKDQRAYARSTLAGLQDHYGGAAIQSGPPDKLTGIREMIQSSLRKREENRAQAMRKREENRAQAMRKREECHAQAKVGDLLQELTHERAVVRSAIYLKDKLDEKVDMDIVRTALQNIKMKSTMKPERRKEKSSEVKIVDRNLAKSTLFALQAREEQSKMSPVYSTPASSEGQCSPGQVEWSRQSQDGAKKSKDIAAQNFAKTLHAPLMQSIMRFGTASEQGSASNQSDTCNRESSSQNRGRDASGHSTPSIDLNFSYQEEKHYEEDISGLRALLPKVLRPDPSNYKISKNIPKGHCYKFIKFGSCPNRQCRFTHIIPADPVIEDIRACHRGNDLLG
jgi:hypothetical protein